MNWNEFDVLRKQVDDAIFEVVMAAQKMVFYWRVEPNSPEMQIKAVAMALDELEKVMAKMPKQKT